MSDLHEREAARDQALAQRFSQLRRSELSELPAPPTAQALAARAGAAAGAQSRSGLWRPSLALAASVLFATVVLVQWPGEQADPAGLYADIMAGASFTTDPLLQVSYSVAPETLSLPGVLEFDVNPDRWAQ